jgi:hypothetical protein
MVGEPVDATRFPVQREAISQERGRGYDDATIAVLFASMPRSFPPPPRGFERWTGHAIRVAMGEAV